MGMGLSVARSIVEAHGGRIAAENNSDRGATMRVFLPLRERTLMTSTIIRGGSETLPIVHVVEDDASTRTATVRFLRASGYVVRAYATATEFLATVPMRTPGCVVLDLRLPGFRAASRFNARSRRSRSPCR